MKKVLYAEDEYTNRKLIELMLAKHGVPCDLAEDGPMALEMFMGDLFNDHIEISRWSPSRPNIALSPHGNVVARRYSRGDMDHNGFGSVDASLSTTNITGIIHDLALTVTALTSYHIHHLPEERAGCLSHLTIPLTYRASFGATSGLCAASMARLTRDLLFDLNLLLYAFGNLFQRKLQFDLKVPALLRSPSTRPRTPAK